jgi:ADP-ribosylglycohydrolase
MGEIEDPSSPTLADRFRGCLLGLATGDAVGTTLEFKSPGTFDPVNDMVGGGPFNLEPGQWTDDTSMALCLADSLLACGGVDPGDQMRRYVRWRADGYRSSTGACFDIGATVASALARYQMSGSPFSGSTEEFSAGNGSLMRLAPAALYYYADPVRAIESAAVCSLTTHGAPAAIDSCRYFAGLLVGAVGGASRDDLLAPGYRPVNGPWAPGELVADVSDVAMGSFKRRNPPEITGTGFVVRSLEAALWAFSRARDFRDGCLMAVNLGNDADTTGAIYGQLAGAYWGVNAIPLEWRDRLAFLDDITSVADALLAAGTT